MTDTPEKNEIRKAALIEISQRLIEDFRKQFKVEDTEWILYIFNLDKDGMSATGFYKMADENDWGTWNSTEPVALVEPARRFHATGFENEKCALVYKAHVPSHGYNIDAFLKGMYDQWDLKDNDFKSIIAQAIAELPHA